MLALRLIFTYLVNQPVPQSLLLSERNSDVDIDVDVDVDVNLNINRKLLATGTQFCSKLALETLKLRALSIHLSYNYNIRSCC